MMHINHMHTALDDSCQQSYTSWIQSTDSHYLELQEKLLHATWSYKRNCYTLSGATREIVTRYLELQEKLLYAIWNYRINCNKLSGTTGDIVRRYLEPQERLLQS